MSDRDPASRHTRARACDPGSDRPSCAARLSWLIMMLASLGVTSVGQQAGSATADRPRPVVPGLLDAGDGRLWVAGDPHVHIQKRLGTHWDTAHWPDGCGDTRCERDEPATHDFSESELLAQMEHQALALACVLVINGGGADLDTMYCDYAPRVRDQQHAVTQDDPHRWLQYDVEVSPFPDTAGRFGHVVALGATDAYYCPLDGFPAAHLDHFRDPAWVGNRAIAGYAHVTWPADPERWPDWFLDDCLGPGDEVPEFTPYPYLAPLDVVLGRVDFLEAARASFRPDPRGDSWSALYYGLLDAGFSPGLAGGSDNSYTGPDMGDCRTWALIDGPLDHRRWAEALAAGATSIVDGPGLILTLEVDGVGLGGHVELAAPGTVSVVARLQRVPGSAALASHPGSTESVGPVGPVGSEGRSEGPATAGSSPLEDLLAGRLSVVRDGGVEVGEATVPGTGRSSGRRLAPSVVSALGGDGIWRLELPLDLDGPTWLAARWESADGRRAAHTAAIPVLLDGRRLRRADALEHWLAWCRILWDGERGEGLLPSMGPLHCAYRDGLWPVQLERQLKPYVAAATRRLERWLGSDADPLSADTHPGGWCLPMGTPPEPLYDPRDPGCDDGR